MVGTIEMDFDVAGAIASLESETRKEIARLKSAAQRTSLAMAREIKQQGDSDISRAGNFSSRWTNDFAVEQSKSELGYKISVFFRTISYAMIHEYGGTIYGKPLLWVPLSFAHVKGGPRDYPGQLFSVNRPGKNPLLFSKNDNRPKFVGVKSVRIPQRFHLRDITGNVVQRKAGEFFFKYLKGGAA